MTLKDLLRKKDSPKGQSMLPGDRVPMPEVKLMRSDTHTQEIINAPTFPEDEVLFISEGKERTRSPSSPRSPSRFRSLSNTSTASKDTKAGNSERPRNERRLSQLLHIRSPSHGSRHSSVHVPNDLPQIVDDTNPSEDREASWEERATLLAKENLNSRRGMFSETTSPSGDDSTQSNSRRASLRQGSDAQGDVYPSVQILID